MNEDIEIHRYPVKVVSDSGEVKTYSREFQTEAQYEQGWKIVLRRARADSLEVNCDCPGQDDKPLSVHYVTTTDNYHLAKYPDTGHLHSRDCIYYSPENSIETQGQGDKSDSVQKEPGHLIKIRLDIGINKRMAGSVERSGQERASIGGGGQEGDFKRIHLGDLLRTLWVKARMNVWTQNMAGKRNIELVHWCLQQAAGNYDAGGLTLDSVLLVSTVNPKSRVATGNAEKRQEASSKNRRLIVVAPLARYKEGMERRDSLPISGYQGIPVLKMDSRAWEDLFHHEPGAIAAWKAGARIEAIVQTDVPSHGQAFVLDVALLRVSDNWIPVCSNIEAMIEEKLVAEGRSFAKPLNAMGEHRKLPSFKLNDVSVGKYLPMVILDRDKEPRRAEYYGNKYGKESWWSWNGRGDIPDFPKGKEIY